MFPIERPFNHPLQPSIRRLLARRRRLSSTRRRILASSRLAAFAVPRDERLPRARVFRALPRTLRAFTARSPRHIRQSPRSRARSRSHARPTPSVRPSVDAPFFSPRNISALSTRPPLSHHRPFHADPRACLAPSTRRRTDRRASPLARRVSVHQARGSPTRVDDARDDPNDRSIPTETNYMNDRARVDATRRDDDETRRTSIAARIAPPRARASASARMSVAPWRVARGARPGRTGPCVRVCHTV